MTRFLVSCILLSCALHLSPAAAASIRPLYAFTGGPNGAEPSPQVLYMNGLIYGAVGEGGGLFYGNLYSLDPVSHAEKVLHAFSNTDGADPNGLVACGDGVYGTTYGGGARSEGTLFQFDPVSGTIATKHNFGIPNTEGVTVDGVFPYGNLVCVAGALFGVTPNGGTAGTGILFRFEITSAKYTIVHDFSLAEGRPASLLSDGPDLYGTSLGDGTQHFGEVFKLNPTTLGMPILYSFTGGADGSAPYLLAAANGKLLGSVGYAVGAIYGNLFSINLISHAKTVLHVFGQTDICPGTLLAVQGYYLGVGSVCGQSPSQGGVTRYNPVSRTLRTIVAPTTALAGYGALTDTPAGIFGTVIYGSHYGGEVFSFLP